MTAKWQAGHTYVPGSLVVPKSGGSPAKYVAANGNFEGGNTGFDYTGGVQFSSSGGYGSANCCIFYGPAQGSHDGEALNQTKFHGPPGTPIIAGCLIQQGASDVDHTRGYVVIRFFDENDSEVAPEAKGNIVNDGRHGAWHSSTVHTVFPAGTVYARAGIHLYQNSSDPVWGDNLVLDSLAPSAPVGLVYKATQAKPGKSGSSEPAWPGTTGVEVTDNQVTWEGIIATQVTWTASPLCESGDAEPTWPQVVGGVVRDGTINWTAQTPQITDKNCPSSKIVQIAAGKVYAADDDIIRYCATVNPLDWSADNDAGYLPFGLQTYGSNPVAAMGLYRSNLVAFNAEGFQMWQVDADPANSQLIDALPVASTHNHALAPVANDLLFLCSDGVRSIGIAASAVNLEAGDVGMPIDALVLAALKAAGGKALATYVPGLGQYWIAFAGAAATTVYVYTMNRIGQVGKWSEYEFPFAIDAFAQLGDDLYMRSGDDLLKLDDSVMQDYAGDPRAVDVVGTVQWPWLDLKKPGWTKQLVGLDVVGTGAPDVSVGYDQRNTGTFTTPFTIPADTVPGQMIPLPVMAPSLSVKLTYPGGQKWQLQAVTLYVQDQRVGT